MSIEYTIYRPFLQQNSQTFLTLKRARGLLDLLCTLVYALAIDDSGKTNIEQIKNFSFL